VHHPPGGRRRPAATLGDIISATVKEAEPESTIPKGKVSAGGGRADVEGGPPQDGSIIRFDDNAAVIIDKAGEPWAPGYSPVEGSAGEEFMKIVSLAPESVMSRLP